MPESNIFCPLWSPMPGVPCSAGERQRVALARAFLRDAPLLLLDEPTANLDRASEDVLVDRIAGRCQGRMVVVVAHRPALLRLADRVVDLTPSVPAARASVGA